MPNRSEFLERYIAELRKGGKKFVRSQDQLTIHTEKATGLVMSIDEVLEVFGKDVIEEVFNHGSAIIVRDASEPAYTFKKRREYLELSIDEVANRALLTKNEIIDCENTNTKISIHTLIRVARVLNLDPRFISWKAGDPNNGFL